MLNDRTNGLIDEMIESLANGPADGEHADETAAIAAAVNALANEFDKRLSSIEAFLGRTPTPEAPIARPIELQALKMPTAEGAFVLRNRGEIAIEGEALEILRSGGPVIATISLVPETGKAEGVTMRPLDPASLMPRGVVRVGLPTRPDPDEDGIEGADEFDDEWQGSGDFEPAPLPSIGPWEIQVSEAARVSFRVVEGVLRGNVETRGGNRVWDFRLSPGSVWTWQGTPENLTGLAPSPDASPLIERRAWRDEAGIARRALADLLAAAEGMLWRPKPEASLTAQHDATLALNRAIEAAREALE